ncbi:hypothetical protein CH380_11155 [Leptospira adleri]|uniref:Uncharacterized protein n=1 Tax=Leptospira adleri TaxID=2023186 RepID=A0A2M9YPA7_9LEPT|nr:hypothetical protein CH380_11155 [Leptospira adleri]PJZ59897.1 hypothetical protein CH376_21315 [Leptospira adleri]
MGGGGGSAGKSRETFLYQRINFFASTKPCMWELLQKFSFESLILITFRFAGKIIQNTQVQKNVFVKLKRLYEFLQIAEDPSFLKILDVFCFQKSMSSYFHRL